jgi:DNA-binding CsgD family transcriptional regulator
METIWKPRPAAAWFCSLMRPVSGAGEYPRGAAFEAPVRLANHRGRRPRGRADEPLGTGPPDGLSEREAEVLRMIAVGHTNAEIAEQLYLSVRTVESHRAHIQQKLRLGSRSELVR